MGLGVFGKNKIPHALHISEHLKNKWNSDGTH